LSGNYRYTRDLSSLDPDVVELWIAREILLLLSAAGPCYPDYIREDIPRAARFFLRKEELQAEFDQEPQRQAFLELYEKVMKRLRKLDMIRPYKWMLMATSHGHQVHDDMSWGRSDHVYVLRPDSEWNRI
jgi:hypothetical protein